MSKDVEFKELFDKTLNLILVSVADNHNEITYHDCNTLALTNKNDMMVELIFETDCGLKYRLWHDEWCCEIVRIEDIVGDLSDLIGSPILRAEEAVSDNWPDGYSGYRYEQEEGEALFLWTFYKLATRKGYVDIRWLGESNGYYSVSVNFESVQDKSEN